MLKQFMTTMLVGGLLLFGTAPAMADSMTFDYTNGLATTLFSGNPTQSYGDLPTLYSDQSDKWFAKNF